MNLSINGTVESFLVAVLVYFLFGAVIDALISDPRSKSVFHIVLLVICVVIALGGTLFVHA